MPDAFTCPICQTALLPGSAVCPGCGEDLAALLHLRSRSTLLYNAALTAARHGQTEDAIAGLIQARIGGPDPRVLTLLGKLYAKEGRTDAARASWTQAIELAPNQAEAEAGLRRLDDLEREAAAGRARLDAEETAARQVERQRAQRRSILALAGAMALGALGLFVIQSFWSRGVATATPTIVAQVTLLPASATPTAPPTPSASPAPSATPAPAATSSPRPPSPTAAPEFAAAVQAAIEARADLASYGIRAVQEGTLVRLVGAVPNVSVRYQVETAARSTALGVRLDLGDLELIQYYVVQPGDSPWSVAQKVLGDGRLYPALLEANHLDEQARFTPGQTLVMPKPEDLAP